MSAGRISTNVFLIGQHGMNKWVIEKGYYDRLFFITLPVFVGLISYFYALTLLSVVGSPYSNIYR